MLAVCRAKTCKKGLTVWVWTAIDVDNQLSEIKANAKEIERQVKFAESNITLPLHVSLKISAWVANDEFAAVVDDLSALFESVAPFEIETGKIELHDTICWIRMQENARLEHLHAALNSLLGEKYGVPLHRFDKCFIYHCTLFLDNDAEKVKNAFGRISAVVPAKLAANKFVIGCSPNGEIGTYKVLKEITVGK